MINQILFAYIRRAEVVVGDRKHMNKYEDITSTIYKSGDEKLFYHPDGTPYREIHLMECNVHVGVIKMGELELW